LTDAGLWQHLGVSEAVAVPGGCINECFRVRIGASTRFLKVNASRYADAFAAEADGLIALRRAGMRAPEPIAHGIAASKAYLLMEYVELKATGNFAALGRALAAMHRKPAERFGWKRDNYIGTTPQANGESESWAQFWREQRLKPQLELARKNGFDFGAEPVIRVVEGHAPQPALLHGDLWGGNAAFTASGEPVVFDPAVYYGDREADLAMTELFGGFAADFYAAYNAAYPLDAGYAERKHVYNLYHLLNHLNLFGRSYLGQVETTLRLLKA
jgi:protein-ribulosamine 3-kinase